MSNKIKFGFRIPASPIDGSPIDVFRDQMFRFIGEVSEHFDSVWFSDHFIPWHPALDPTTATLEAIRANRPTATPPSPSGIRWPYISPNTWRSWALRILAVAGLLAYIGLRLRRGQ